MRRELPLSHRISAALAQVSEVKADLTLMQRYCSTNVGPPNPQLARTIKAVQKAQTELANLLGQHQTALKAEHDYTTDPALSD
jgi:hypothetical protein